MLNNYILNWDDVGLDERDAGQNSTVKFDWLESDETIQVETGRVKINIV